MATTACALTASKKPWGKRRGVDPRQAASKYELRQSDIDGVIN
jgi:hypothetical protein